MAGPLSPAATPFEANGFRLDDGVVLLEASAGTGKTFALAHLVLRLLGERGLSLRELLVVTYTNAAAAELRDRIGRRIQEALAGLQALDDGSAAVPWQPPDAVLQQWIDGQGADSGRRALLQGQLLLALEDLDAADITTIHGFCQRTLKRQSLAAARPPELVLDTDPGELVRQVAHDYWQQQVLALPTPLVAGLAGLADLEDLERLLLLIDGDPGLVLEPLPPELSLERPLNEQLEPLWEVPWQTFRLQWQARGASLEQDFRAAAGQWKAAGATRTAPYSQKPTKDRCGLVDRWIAAQPPEGDYAAARNQEELTRYFHPGPFSQEARRAEGSERVIRLPQPELLEAVADVLEGPAERLLLHGCHWCRRELARRRTSGGRVGFAQLLEGLDPGPEALEPSPLLRAVGERYRAVLVDEFQDTDPVQWRILRLAFGAGDHLLVMVGDPKQAIYRFRGGDLDTYRLAAASAGRVHALLENRRASPALLGALNGLMEPAGLPRSALPVPAVRARSLRSGPDGMAPVRLLWLGSDRSAGEPLPSRSALESELPARIAACVAELLQEAPGLSAGDGEPKRPLRAGDIALLVHNHHQAETLRRALERLGIASRLVSKADVFASPAATALQRLLDALADPADPNRLRLLAASPLLGWSARTIAAADSAAWSALAGQLADLARNLPREGLLASLSRLVDSGGLARLSAGGRLLADLQQVAELLQERLHADQLGLVAAADWLRRLRRDQRRTERGVPDNHQAHSDKVDDAVTVITVHRSKGLEFPVVICPYLWQAAGTASAGRSGPGVRWHPTPEAGAHLDLHLRPQWGQGWKARRQHRDAERAERERLAYVALTRAQHLLVIAWGPAKEQQANPLVPWLFPDDPLPDPEEDTMAGRSDAEWCQRLAEEIRRRGLALDLVGGEATAQRPARAASPQPGTEALQCGPVPGRPFDRSWGRSSYTAWTSSSHAAPAPALALDEGRDTLDPSLEGAGADPSADDAGAGAAWAEQGPLGRFARGPVAGDALHRMLERLDVRLASDAPGNRELVECELRRAGLAGEPLEPLLQGLELMRLTPFGGALGRLRVADLAPERRLHEMNFDLTLGYARAAGLAAAFRNHPGGAFGSCYAAALERLPVASRGFLTGSIDLVFTTGEADADGRWWVADWKSNWIGQRDEEGQTLACGPRHYGQGAMETLMAASHYPLQAHLYLVALHRYLRWRLPGYDPARHLGGYAYVFLRGTPGDAGHGALPGTVPGMFVEQPPLERILALDDALGRSATAAP